MLAPRISTWEQTVWALPRDDRRPHLGHSTHPTPAQEAPSPGQEEAKRPGTNLQGGGLQLLGDGAGCLHVLCHELRAMPRAERVSEPSRPMPLAPT